jgi:signal transduction histidine kinase/ActR/RegA family two-component response regulator
VLRALVESAGAATGEAFFRAIVDGLVSALGVKHAFVAVVEDPPTHVRTLAIAWDGAVADETEYELAGTPCEHVIARGETAFHNGDVARRFPQFAELALRGIDTYLGAPIRTRDGNVLGVLAVLHDRPIDTGVEPVAVVEIFAARAAAELERMREEEARRALEQQLAHAQKMEGIGRLAGGVAHDFNNLLTVILSHAQLAEDELPPDGPLRELVVPIREAAQRASALTRQLLAFARRQVVTPVVLDVNESVRGVGRLLQRLLGENVVLGVRLAHDLWPVRIDPGQLEQVIVNLAVNARDAMPAGGRLSVSTSNAPLEAPEAHAHGIAPGDFVRLVVADTGVGMDEETRRRAFEPFFTTKGERGTGLGLATCLGIAQQAGGTMWAESEPGKGAALHLLLPRHVGARARESGTAAASAPAYGPATVLVVEDEELVRRTAVLALRRAGYGVLSAATGPEALRVASEHAGPIELLLTDVVLPGMSGPDLAARLAAARPEMRVLYVSGYAEDDALRATATADGAGILPKPYGPGDLAASVAALVGADRGRAG